MPDLCVPFFAERIKPVKMPSRKLLAEWITDLDSTSFKARIRATEELTNLNELAVPALKTALEGNLPLEPRRRIERILAEADPTRHCPTLMQNLRAIEVLERIGTPAARRLLEYLASGAADARLTMEATESLARLNRRPQ
jgi:hypothetical protein